MLMLFSEVLAEFPALSRQNPVTDWPPPSPRVDGGEVLWTPDRASEQAKMTVTVALYQLFEFGVADRELVIAGGVWSMLIPEVVAELVLPALSVHVPVTDSP